MKRRMYCFILISLFGLSSCSRKYYSKVDRVIPPRIKIPAHMNNLRVLDRSKESNLSIRFENAFENISIGHNAKKEFVRKASSLLPSNTKINPNSLRDSHAGSPANVLSKGDQRKYAEGASGLLCLELFRPREIREYVDYRKHQLDEDGKDYYIDAVRCLRVNSLEVLWRLYDPTSGEIIFEKPYLNEIITEFEALSRSGVNEKIDSSRQVSLAEVQNPILDQMKNDFQPREVRSSWLYFKRGGDVVKRSAEFIKKGEFGSAAGHLFPRISGISKLKHRERAQYNLALSYYMEGEDSSALNILSKIRDNKDALELIWRIETD